MYSDCCWKNFWYRGSWGFTFRDWPTDAPCKYSTYITLWFETFSWVHAIMVLRSWVRLLGSWRRYQDSLCICRNMISSNYWLMMICQKHMGMVSGRLTDLYFRFHFLLVICDWASTILHLGPNHSLNLPNWYPRHYNLQASSTPSAFGTCKRLLETNLLIITWRVIIFTR